MDKIVVVKGMCPTQNKEYSIDITYKDASTLTESVYVKGLYSCEYNKYGDKCNGNQCPIYKNHM